jgi:hypothetical protein
VQSNILASSSDPRLRVYAVWLPFLNGTKTAVNPTVLGDPRVSEFWDQQAVTSQWVSSHVTHQPFPTWDYYLLFGPGAKWGTSLQPIVSQGGDVIGRSGALRSAIGPLLN